MERLDRLRVQTASIAELRQVVSAMRFSAAANTQRAQGALTGIRAYVGVIVQGISEAVSLLPEAPETMPRAGAAPPRRLLVFGAEHGFVGSFNEALLDRAEAELRARPAELCVIGRRAALKAEERGLKPALAQSMASHVEGVLETARRVTAQLFHGLEAGGIAAIDTIFAQYESGGLHRVELRSLLPLDLRAFAAPVGPSPPLHNLPPDLLLHDLLDEYLLAQLTVIAMESLASENGARLHAMGEAQDKIDQRLAELRSLEHQLRQEAVTLELVEVVTGSTAILG